MPRNSSWPMAVAFGIWLVTAPVVVDAAPILWTDWTTADASTASGTAGAVAVSFTGSINPAAQTAGGTNFWAVNSSIFTSVPEVDNPPPDSDIVRLTGGTGTGLQTISFSSPVTNPVMAIMSLGRPTQTRTYVFGDEAFEVLNSGTGFFGGSAAGSLSEIAGNTLQGIEGHGVIQFIGTFTSIDWTIPTDEFWHGFQVGIPPQVVPEPLTFSLLVGGLAAAALRSRLRSHKRGR